MPATPSTPPQSTRWIDAVDVRLGTWLSGVGVAVGVAYALMTWGAPHRMAMVAILLAGLAASLAVQAATPWLVRNERRAQIFFPSWSLGYVAMISGLAALDGGPESPIRTFLFVPVVFAALAYPLRSAVTVAVATVAAFAALSLATGGLTDADVLIVGGALASTAVLAIRQARSSAARHAALFDRGESLRESEARFRGGFEHSPVGMALIAPDGRYVSVNDALCRMLGRPREELLTRTFLEVTHPDELEGEQDLMDRILAGELDHVRHDKRYLRPDGRVVWASIGESAVREPDGSVRYFHTHALDVTEQRESERRAHRRAAQQAEVAALGQAALGGLPPGDLLERAADAVSAGLEVPFAGVAELRSDGRVVPRAVRGWSPDTVIPAGPGRSQSGLTIATGGPVIMRDARTERRFDTTLALEGGQLSGATVPIPGPGEMPFGVLAAHAAEPDRFEPDDVSFLQALANVLAGALARESVEQLLVHQSLHDSLTGLPNRVLLQDRLGHALSRAERTDETIAVLFLDVDHFKTVNDAFGHTRGDELLRELGPRLQGAVRAGDTLARFGGDEFVVLCEGLREPADALVLAERLLAVFAKPFVLGAESGHVTEHHLSGSVGVAVAGPAHAGEPDALVRDADTAMYRAKRTRGRVEVFDEHTRDGIVERVRTTGELRRALERDELFLVYQPIVDLVTGAVEHVEALVRWAHPERGLVSPAEFIPLAEESGLILALGEQVLDRALAQMAAWDAGANAGLRGMRVALNLSARQLVEPGVPEMVVRALERHGVAAERLVCEITETALIDDPLRAAATVDALHRAGVPVSLDDFCTGYSALEHLKRFPLSAIKLDRTFVAEVATNAADLAIVSGLVEIAGAMALSTVAEGVESPEQLARLREVGCHFAQGYLFAEPLEPERLAAYLDGLADGRVDLTHAHELAA